MGINYDVYGQPETWQNCYYGGGLSTVLATLLKASRAKIPTWKETNPDWTFGSGQLRSGINDHKLVYHEPIDKSICTVGMDPTTSPFKSFAVWGNYPEVHTYMIGTAELGEEGYANSIFWFEANCVATGFTGVYGNNAFSKWRMPLENLDKRVYAPQGNNGDTNTTQNGNFFIAPFTEFGARAFILQILVYVQTSTTHHPPYSVEPAGTWRTLDDWKNNYSDHTISGCQLRYRYLSSYTQNTGKMNYYSANWGSSEYRKVAAAFADEFKVKIDAGGDYNFYDYGIQSPGNNIGAIRLFGDIDGLYEWTDDLQPIALVPWYVNNYIQIATSNQLIFPIVPYSDDIYDTIMAVTAHFGVPFTPGKSTSVEASNCAFSDDFLDDDLYLPVIDDNGITHGEYTHGADNANNSYYDFDKSSDSGYDPSKPPIPIDPNTYSNTTGFNSIAAGASATIKYVLDSSNIRQLLTDLWTISHNIAGADYEKYDYKILDSFLVSNPIDSIVSIKRFPFEIPHTFSTQKTNVCLGKNTGSSQGYVTHNVFNTVIFSGVRIFPKFENSFLDYAPYTEYELYIPFCGTVKLNAGDILDHTLNCRLQIDLTTGSCTAYILADDLVIETASGVVSCELQVAGTDSATVDSAIQNAVINHIGARTNKEIAMLSPLTFGGLLSAVSNPVKTSGAMENANNEISRADYNLTHIQTPVHSMGNAGGLTGWYQEFNARLIIYYPEGEAIDSSAPVSSTSPHLADLTAYAHNVGFACVMNGTVSEFHGKTVGNIDTSSIVGATEEERAQIKALFAQGV